MSADRKIHIEIKKGSFAEMEELDIEYYASISWKESAANAEQMRRMIWSKEYNLNKERNVSVAKLKGERNDLE
ncbi:MAG TPA: hypothetical protein VK645_09990 [Chitinophagaceae bacterium]|nr:hypothetical protein [Chitinophagaceae bacterium]